MNDALGMPQTAVVIGGTSDIARYVVRELATRRLSRVVLAARDQLGSERVADELRTLGVEAHCLVLDVTEISSHPAFVESVRRLLGHVDLVLLAAGILGGDQPPVADPAEVAQLFATNCSGPCVLAGAFVSVLIGQGHGRLVVLSSVAGVRVRRANFDYGASKAGLDAYAQGLSLVVEDTGVSVTIVRPGWVATRLTRGRLPAPFATTPQAVAADIVKGFERGAAVVWSPRVLRPVFAVGRLLPTGIWRRLPA